MKIKFQETLVYKKNKINHFKFTNALKQFKLKGKIIKRKMLI